MTLSELVTSSGSSLRRWQSTRRSDCTIKAGCSKCSLDGVATHDPRRTCARLCHEAGSRSPRYAAGNKERRASAETGGHTVARCEDSLAIPIKDPASLSSPREQGLDFRVQVPRDLQCFQISVRREEASHPVV